MEAITTHLMTGPSGVCAEASEVLEACTLWPAEVESGSSVSPAPQGSGLVRPHRTCLGPALPYSCDS